MKKKLTVAGTAIVLGLTLAAPIDASGAMGSATKSKAAAIQSVRYEMNEGAGATVMVDSGANHVNGAIGSHVQTGYHVLGATGYHWARRAPALPPAEPQRVIQVPDNALLDPGSGTFTVTIRYRTKEKFGNVIQKGQAASKGGQWKFQNPGGVIGCLFKGSMGQAATNSKTALNDNTWHTVSCTRSATSVTMYVDGVFRSRKNGATGVIDNKIPMTIAGKINCDQVKTTCDYYSGEIDYVRIDKG